MQTGSPATTTGLYRSECACAQIVRIGRAEDAPTCPRCRRSVSWLYLRSEYRAHPVDDRLDLSDALPDALPSSGSATHNSPPAHPPTPGWSSRA